MIVESPSTFESVLGSVHNWELRLQQLLTISDRLMAVFNRSLTDLMSTTAINQVNYCRVYLD